MNKVRKGFLTASSIITIVAVAGAILTSLFCFCLGGIFDEEFLKESYKTDIEYTYYENADGSYYFSYIEEGQEVRIGEDEIELLADIVSGFGFVVGFATMAFAVAKLVFAIRILIFTSKNKFAKASVITLMVLSILTFNILETVFLIIALSVTDSSKTPNNQSLASNSIVNSQEN